jgi:hypothetical protein
MGMKQEIQRINAHSQIIRGVAQEISELPPIDSGDELDSLRELARRFDAFRLGQLRLRDVDEAFDRWVETTTTTEIAHD